MWNILVFWVRSFQFGDCFIQYIFCEYTKDIQQIVWSTFMILLWHLIYTSEISHSPSQHLVSLYWKEWQGYSSKMCILYRKSTTGFITRCKCVFGWTSYSIKSRSKGPFTQNVLFHSNVMLFICFLCKHALDGCVWALHSCLALERHVFKMPCQVKIIFHFYMQMPLINVLKQRINQKIPEAGQALQILFTVDLAFTKSIHVMLTYVDLYLSLPHIWPVYGRFIYMHLNANAQHHSQWLNPRVCTSLRSSCLLPVFSPKAKNWKNPRKETKICSGKIQLLLHSPRDIHPPTFLTPTAKKMCHLEMDYGWEKERGKKESN